MQDKYLLKNFAEFYCNEYYIFSQQVKILTKVIHTQMLI